MAESTVTPADQIEAAEDLAQAIATNEWQPTSPWTLLRLFANVLGVFAVYFIYQFTKIGLKISLPQEVLEQIHNYAPWLTEALIMGFIELAIPVCIAFMPILHWWSIRWRLDEQTIELRQGILWRKHQKMARSRVQTVSLKADIVGRLTNTRSVVISSGDTEDIVISLVGLAMAEQMRIVIAPKLDQAHQPLVDYVRDPLRDALVGDSPDTPRSVEHLLGVQHVPADTGPTERIDIMRMSGLDWAKYVALTTAPHVLMTLICTIPVVIVGAFVIAAWADGISGIIAAISVPAVMAMLLPVAFGISMAQINTWGFTSWIQDGRVHSVQGLISRIEKGAALPRLQTVNVAQNPLRLWLKLDEINVTTADAAMGEQSAETMLNLVHPMLPAGQWRELATQLLGVSIPNELNPPSKRTIARGMVRVLQVGVLVAVVAAVTEQILVGTYWSGLILGGLTLLAAYPVGLWRYHNLRWAINDTCFVIRRGLLFRHITVVPLNLIQNVVADATFFQRRLGLGDVDADVAGLNAPKARAHDLPIDQAERIEAVLVAHANTAVSKDGV